MYLPNIQMLERRLRSVRTKQIFFMRGFAETTAYTRRHRNELSLTELNKIPLKITDCSFR